MKIRATATCKDGGLSVTLQGKLHVKEGCAGSICGFWIRVYDEAMGKFAFSDLYLPYSIFDDASKKIISAIIRYENGG